MTRKKIEQESIRMQLCLKLLRLSQQRMDKSIGQILIDLMPDGVNECSDFYKITDEDLLKLIEKELERQYAKERI